MTKLKKTTAPVYAHSANSLELKQQFDAFINELVDPSLSVDAIAQALSGGIDALAAVLRPLPAIEGRLIELGIAAVARCNTDLKVLTQNLRLPVSPTALQIVEMNHAENFRALTFDSDMGGRKTYTPDFVILNQRTNTAHVVDAKRSVYTYDRVRLVDLQNRMKAAGLSLPDFLYKEHQRLNVKEVRIVILTADSRKTDLNGGIWHLSQLDHLVQVEGAGAAIASLQAEFRSRVDEHWKQACAAFAQACHSPIAPPGKSEGTFYEVETDDEDNQSSDESDVMDVSGNAQLIKLGFAQAPTRH